MSVAWNEPACLVRARIDPHRELVREIVIEDSFANVARALARLGTEHWAELTISFTERRRPPFHFGSHDFEREVVGRLLGADWAVRVGAAHIPRPSSDQ